MKDKYGTEIEVGDVIAYAQRRGSHCWIDRARVISSMPAATNRIGVEVDERNDEWDPTTRAFKAKIVQRKTWFSCGDRAIVLSKGSSQGART